MDTTGIGTISAHRINWSELPEQKLTTVANHVEETLRGGFRRLGFPAPLEDIFEQETGAARVRHMVIAGLVAILIYDAFLFSDYLTTPDIFKTALIVRLGIFTPLTLLIMATQYRGLTPHLRECAGAFASVVGSVGLIYLLMLSGDPNASYPIYGLILVIMFGNIVLQLRFWYAAAASLASVFIYSAVIFTALSPLPIAQVNNILILFSTALLTAFANHSLERDQRRSYLLNLRERIRRAALSERNDKLMELSHIDPLTGLANRRELAEYLDLLLQKPATDKLAIVMLDVDHFKLYNDYYGHPMGDECLRKIAGVLTESTRHGADLVVRFGGEEFVAVLPGCEIAAAERFAERILKAVQDLSIPHITSPISDTVSISAGVAVGLAGDSTDVQALLARADSALYRAKSSGRNCVQH